MSWLSSHGNVLSGLGTVASFIPGVGPLVGAGLAGIGGMLSASEAQGQANQSLSALKGSLAQQEQLRQMLMPYYQSLLDQTFNATNVYGNAGPNDPYSPLLNEAQSQGYRDDTAAELRRQMAASDYYLRPQGGVRSSAQEYARAQAIRDASSQNAAFARNLRVQGGIERYNNMVNASNERFRRMQGLLGAPPGNPGAITQGYQGLYNAQQGAANDLYGGLGQTIAAMAKNGAFTPKGPQGGQTGANRGNNDLNTNQVGGYAPWSPTVYDPNMGGDVSIKPGTGYWGF